MKFNREHWSGKYLRDKFPCFKCPRCKEGTLLLVNDALSVTTPQYSVSESREVYWDPEHNVERFSAKLVCDYSKCGEIVIAIGDTSTDRDFDEESEEKRWIEVLQPKSFFPAPPIIEIPDKAPEKVKDEIDRATQLFWIDFNSCANRVRVSVENLLDYFEIAKTGINKKDEEYNLDLNARIELYKIINPDHAQTLTALRMIGNLGSHGGNVTREPLLDAFEIYEHALMELFGGHKERIGKIRQKLIDTKGKY